LVIGGIIEVSGFFVLGSGDDILGIFLLVAGIANQITLTPVR
jgi:hypothetical protein